MTDAPKPPADTNWIQMESLRGRARQDAERAAADVAFLTRLMYFIGRPPSVSPWHLSPSGWPPNPAHPQTERGAVTLEAQLLETITSIYNSRYGAWQSTEEMLAAMAEAAAHTAEHHNSTPIRAEDAITALRKSAEVIRIQLAGAVMAACPGSHQPVQHRDGRPPWCAACGYTRDGERIKTPAQTRVGTNSGHGHVWERPDGVKVRCGGPGMCSECSRDQQLLARDQ